MACLFTLGGGLPVAARADSRPDPAEVRAEAECPVDEPSEGVALRPGAEGLTHAVEPREPGPEEIARMSADLRRRLEESGGMRRVPATGEIMVPLWVHVIKDGALGLSDAGVKRQVDTLNAAYGGRLGGVDTGVRFVLTGITHTLNKDWFRDPLGNEAAIKTKLRVGGAETLNLYIAQLGELVLGYATYPYWYQGEPQLDGVVIDWRSVPGGPLRNFDKGFTAVHEIGHWLGLLHTFENGCATPGDAVDDTPPEAYPTTGCPPGKDTCTEPGEDPVHNFMDYAQDRCMTNFTAGQAVRMRQMWDLYRRPTVPAV
ncbi:zinc metalloprotease [Planotetraspora mira]|uniref:Zinc metalloprotease n=1 Tax=Planotetraspora mira TaxID=58121 RepID=A0A8J3X8H2_9ACTN|nr:zinc metalloprotease [Planotetraspora mira]GII30964.1 zinc metalloprotease [Planotetraspora mira]